MTKELHHIVPRCMGGSDDPSNLVLISARAHAILSVYQSEHYGRPCIHRRQLKYLPPHLYERGKFWLREAAKLGAKSRREKANNESEYLEELYKQAKLGAKIRRERFKSDLEYRREQSRRGSLSWKNRYVINNGTIEKFILISDPIPLGWIKGRMRRYVINDGTTNKHIPLTVPLPAGWVKGRVRLK